MRIHSGDFRERADELASLLDQAVPVMARQVLVALAPKNRTADESQFLFDCCRGRREASRETLAMLLVLDARAKSFALADTVRVLTVKQMPAAPPAALLDVALDAEEADVALDRVRTLYADEKSPIRAAQMWECAVQMKRKLEELVDVAAQHMHLSPTHHKRAS